ncbi:MAG: hypothetical protein HY509_00435 [Acidobacteria bacterium]|nr:hypothetical protein [Acidobacteriota bacterium]
MEEKVVAHYKDGKTLRGTTRDFDPDRDVFHILPCEGGAVPSTVRMQELKALFYVKEYGGLRRGPGRSKAFGLPKDRPGKRTVVEFRDGETVWGYTRKYSPEAAGFFFVPADPDENNMKMFILNSSIRGIRFEE